MTKDIFLTKWVTDCAMVVDLEAVIATEIAKAQEVKLEDAQPQPALNPIEQAYERGEKIRCIRWSKGEWIKKHSESQAITNLGDIFVIVNLINTTEYFTTHPHFWELYTEPTKQPSSQVKLDNSFDKERFESMFRAVVASGRTERWEQDFKFTEEALAKLDAYYASNNN